MSKLKWIALILSLVSLLLAAGCIRIKPVPAGKATPTPTPGITVDATAAFAAAVQTAVEATITTKAQKPIAQTPTVAPTATPGPTQRTTVSPSSISTPGPTQATVVLTQTATLTTTLATACRNIGDTQVSPVDGMTLLCVPAGEFLMGSTDADADAEDDEKPQHTVYLDAFWIDRTEVTKDQYQQCVAEGQCAAPGCSGTGGGGHPVVCVWWGDARDYCAWAGRRLPTEAEWEKAARGTDGRKYPWGNEVPDVRRLNFCDYNCVYDWKDNAVNDGYADAAPVGSYAAGASPYGALDMAGNVGEWVADWYDAKYYASSQAQNPQGSSSTSMRILRGGSWIDGQRGVRAARRSSGFTDNRSVTDGFRCARSS